jgi:hypothetical protein
MQPPLVVNNDLWLGGVEVSLAVGLGGKRTMDIHLVTSKT